MGLVSDHSYVCSQVSSGFLYVRCRWHTQLKNCMSEPKILQYINICWEIIKRKLSCLEFFFFNTMFRDYSLVC